MYRSLAHIISYAFHPLIMATGLIALLYFFAPSVISPISESSIRLILIMVFILTYVIPLISIGMLKLTSNISSMRLSNRKERVMPFIFVTIYYGLTTYLFYSKLVFGTTLIVIFLSITAIILLVALISLFYKISAHSAGAWGMVGFMTSIHFKYPDSMLFFPIIVAILMAGIISSSRLALDEHSLGEVTYGSFMGFVVSSGCIYLLT